MELKWLEDLLALLEERSVSRAAVRRHVTQPAYSRRIRQLEQWLDVELVDRSTKPIRIREAALTLEASVRDLVNRFYGLRNQVHEARERVTFVAQHSLAMSRLPKVIQAMKLVLPDPSYRVVPADYEACEALFYQEADLLLCYQNQHRQFDFSQHEVIKVNLGTDRLIPVATPKLSAELGTLKLAMKLPLLLYQQGGFLAEALAGSCLPEVIRDYRVESICESAFSASLKEMALADMGIAWLASEMIEQELREGFLQSYESTLGSVELDIVLYYRDEGLAAKVGELTARLGNQPS